MWFYFCSSIVFAYFISLNKAQNALDPRETEAIFASVIRNISRVNNVLQDLIQNYEHLQKIYKSQENLESTSSDDEIDEAYKNNRNGRSKDVTEDAGNLPATQMIWSDEESDNKKNVETEANSESKDDENYESPSYGQQELNTSPNPKVTFKIANAENSIHSHHPTSPKETKTKRPKEPANVYDTIAEPDPALIFFVDDHKSYPAEKNVIESSVTPKTRYSKVFDWNSGQKKQKLKSTEEVRLRNSNDSINAVGQRITNLKHIKSKHKQLENKYLTNTELINRDSIEPTTPHSLYDKDNRRKVEKKVHSESFQSKNIWGEIISNKPIKLEAHTEKYSEALRDTTTQLNSQKHSNRSNSDPKTKTALIVPKKNQTENVSKHKEVAVSQSSEGSSKDEFEATVLREAYEDACLKVVIRKCYKACKSAGKSICQTFHCKKVYTSYFNDMAKKGCLGEFDKPNRQKKIWRNSGKTDLAVNDTDSYMEACLPHIETELRNLNNTTREGSKLTSTLNPPKGPVAENGYNILRDKYESACRDVSYKKCNAACSYTYKRTCDLYECPKNKKKAYDKACKKDCKAAFKTNKGYSSVKKKYSSRSSDYSSISSDSDSKPSKENAAYGKKKRKW